MIVKLKMMIAQKAYILSIFLLQLAIATNVTQDMEIVAPYSVSSKILTLEKLDTANVS